MCTQPIKAFQEEEAGLKPCFDFSRGYKEQLRQIELPCGKCPECCKNYYTDWATRGHRELLMWETSIFATFTYSPEHLPKDMSLDKRAMQNCIKRIKKHFNSSTQNPIRQIYCGEYGTQTLRPHYHGVLFNLDLFDKKPFRTTEQGHQVFTSATLTALWGKGHVEFGFATPATIAYLFKYVLKKVSRKDRAAGPRINTIDGKDYRVAHEFIEGSRNPGIGAWTRDTASIKKGYLTLNGVRKRLPKYYLEHLKKVEPDIAEAIRDQRFDFMSNRPPETTLRKKQKQNAQKLLTSLKKKL